MKKLLSLSDDPWSVEKLGGPDAVREAIAKNAFDGIELVRWHDPQPLPGVTVVGRHMPYWPTWLDFWRGDDASLMRQFGSTDNVRTYFSAASREDFVRQRRAELEEAEAMGAQYAVFHVCHSELEHCYNHAFTYTDEDIVRAFVEFINEVTAGLQTGPALLFENHWFPGLKLNERRLAELLMTEVHYPNKGFVLDTSHMMLSSGVKTESEAVEMILRNIEGLGDMIENIRTVHLNSAEGAHPLDGKYNSEADFETRLMEAFQFVGSMDPHKPFQYDGIQRVLDAAEPEFLVYELSYGTKDELREAVRRQDGAVGPHDK